MSQDNNAPAAVRATRKRKAPPPPPPPPPTEMAAGADAVEWQESRTNNAPAAVRATRKRKAPATFGSAHIPSSHEAAAAKRMAQPTVASAAKVVGAGRGRGRTGARVSFPELSAQQRAGHLAALGPQE